MEARLLHVLRDGADTAGQSWHLFMHLAALMGVWLGAVRLDRAACRPE